MFSVGLVWHKENQGRDFAFSCLPGKVSVRPQVTHCLGSALWIGPIHFCHYIIMSCGMAFYVLARSSVELSPAQH